ncbi:twin-arginine translocase TatA/TatE family subunit [Oleiharenicola sp. Vm1]|uniref:twin-arginine translocase TatA/TatE family subunit n=1 Tax=Oleiharenicola sp. Vm1 TaxID=3398393 RepID=UPI0039F4E429
MSHVTLPLAGLFGLGGPELILILVILLLLFGGSKLPQLAKGLGQSVKEFKKASKEDEEEDKKPAAKSETKPGNN